MMTHDKLVPVGVCPAVLYQVASGAVTNLEQNLSLI